MIYDSILSVIGHTPMVRINKLNPNPKIQIVAKLEGFNPTGSIKDRIELKMRESLSLDKQLLKQLQVILVLD